MTKRMALADGMLLLTAMIWGLAFVVVKNTVETIPPAQMVTMRHAIAAALTALLFGKQLRGLTRWDVARGALIGTVLGLAYCIQTDALRYTTAGKNAFLTTLYVLLVPVLGALFLGMRLHRRTLGSAALMFLGIALLSLGDVTGGLNRGDVLTLLCSVFYAIHILLIERYQKRTDVRALVVLQFAFCALVSFFWQMLFEGRPVPLTQGSLGGLLYLAVISSTLGISLQNIGQSMTRSDHAVVLLSLESVFGALGGFVLLGEQVTPVMGVGFGMIFGSLLLNELCP